MATFNEPARIGDVLKREYDALLNREIVTIADGEILLLGAVVGQIAAAREASSAAKSGGNTGTGALTLDVTTPVVAGAKLGVYTVRCIAAASGSGTFRVSDPDGFVLGDVVVGATFENDIKFAIADGDPDFIVGDGFDITVVADDDATDIGHYSAFDGTQTAVAIALEPVDASEAATLGCVLMRGPAVVSTDALVWAEGVTDDQKATALATLLAAGIVARTGIGGAPVAFS